MKRKLQMKIHQLYDLVNQIIANGVAQRASDIHFDPQETELRVRYRVDGILKNRTFITKTYAKYYYCSY